MEGGDARYGTVGVGEGVGRVFGICGVGDGGVECGVCDVRGGRGGKECGRWDCGIVEDVGERERDDGEGGVYDGCGVKEVFWIFLNV